MSTPHAPARPRSSWPVAAPRAPSRSGVLQYLIGVERIVPEIVTATSAGAIAATVLAQARTLDEFAQRVDEIEGDVLAMTSPEQVFGKQEWLDALDGTRLGREIQQEITEGTRPPFPLGSAMTLPGDGLVPAASSDRQARRNARRARRRRQRHLLRLLAGAWLRLPRVRRRLRTSGSSVLNLEPLADALHDGANGIGAVDAALIRRPGLQLRLAVTALRAGVLRYVTEDGTIVESDARTPAPDESAGPGRRGRRGHRLGQRAHALPAPRHGRRRLRGRRRDRDHPGAGRRRARGDPHHRRGGGAAACCPATSVTTPTHRRGISGCGRWP